MNGKVGDVLQSVDEILDNLRAVKGAKYAEAAMGIAATVRLCKLTMILANSLNRASGGKLNVDNVANAASFQGGQVIGLMLSAADMIDRADELQRDATTVADRMDEADAALQASLK